MADSFSDENSLFKFVVKDGNGVKGLVDSGIAKVPERYVQPPNERIDHAPLEQQKHFTSIPIDLSELDGAHRDEVVEAIIEAAQTLGFFQVINHGMDLELLESVKAASHQFFEQPPEKNAVYLRGVSPSPMVAYGTSFAPEKEKALEWKDYVSMTYTTDEDAKANWPKECVEESLEFLKLSSKMVRKLVEILLKNLDEELDDSKLDALTGFKMVNINFYPPCPNPDLTVGVGRHSDMGTLTVLLQDEIRGLYVKLEEDNLLERKKHEWIEVRPIPGALVVNIGDSLQILSNGRYKSAEHRVRTTSTYSRVSIPVFTTPRPTEKIGPLPQLVERDGGALYREVVFQDYKSNFLGHAHNGKKSLDFAKI